MHSLIAASSPRLTVNMAKDSSKVLCQGVVGGCMEMMYKPERAVIEGVNPRQCVISMGSEN